MYRNKKANHTAPLTSGRIKPCYSHVWLKNSDSTLPCPGDSKSTHYVALGVPWALIFPWSCEALRETHLLKPECDLGTYQECFMRGKESRAQRVMEYSFLSSIPPKPCAVAFLAVYYWQRKCWFMVWVTGNLVSWWRNKPGGAASKLLCQFLSHALLLGLHPERLRRGRASSGWTSEVTFPWNWIRHRLLAVPL